MRNSIGHFQDRYVSLDLSVLDAGHIVLVSHVAQLNTYIPDVHDFEPSPEQQAVLVAPRMGSATMAGMLLTKSNPSYPQMAVAHRVSGVVILHATIGKDGTSRISHRSAPLTNCSPTQLWMPYDVGPTSPTYRTESPLRSRQPLR